MFTKDFHSSYFLFMVLRKSGFNQTRLRMSQQNATKVMITYYFIASIIPNNIERQQNLTYLISILVKPTV